MAPLIKFKAGQMHRIGDTNSVIAAEDSRGLIYLQEEDGLLHFCHKNLVSNEVDDLIIFPGDATFIKAAPRVYCLKFNSSSTRSFFYMQDVDDSLDVERVKKVNELLGAEEEEEEVSAPIVPVDVDMEGIATLPPTTASTSAPIDQSSQISSILASFLNSSSNPNPSYSRSTASQLPAYTLPSVLPPSVLLPLFSTLSPESLSSLTSLLPPSFPPTVESLRTAISSPAFRSSTASLDRALRTGALGPLVRQLGLPESGALGVENFLEEIQKQGDKEKEEEAKKMQE